MRLAQLIMAAALLTSCISSRKAAESPLEYTENAQRAYEEALEDYFDRDWETLVPRMETVRREYSYSRYARLAELRIADARFEQEKYPEAIADYKSFVHDYPNDAEVPYARFRIAKAQFHASSATFLLPPLEERDLAQVRDAYATIRNYLRDYPGTKYAPELDYMFLVVEGLLVRHELYVARFYLNDGRFGAAEDRVLYALEHFTNSRLVPEALVLLGEIHMKQRDRAKARAVFERVLQKHSASAFTQPAKRFLAELERMAPAPNDGN